MTGKKTEPPFGLAMDFGEALSRFVATKPKEVVDSIERSKAKKPPQDAAPRRPARLEREGPPSGRNRRPSGD